MNHEAFKITRTLVIKMKIDIKLKLPTREMIRLNERNVMFIFFQF